MPRNLVAADVAVTLLPEDMDYSPQAKTESLPDITFGAGDGSLLYPALGIPMPDLSKFGMRKEIKRVRIEQPANGFIYHFDRANHKLRIFQVAADPGAPSIAAASAGTPAGAVAKATPAGTVDADTHAFTGAELAEQAFTGQALGEHTHVLTGGAGAAGPLVELGNVAVPVTTLYLTVKGQ